MSSALGRALEKGGFALEGIFGQDLGGLFILLQCVFVFRTPGHWSLEQQ